MSYFGRKIFKKERLAFYLIVVGTLVWSLTMIKSGLLYDYGIGFWGPNGHDGIWHLALIKSLARQSWQMPVFSGTLLSNYHVGFDILAAVLHRLTFIPISTLYFQVLPPVFAVFMGYFVYKLVKLWKGSDSKAIWALFFIYFGGSLGWILTFLKDGSLGGESLFWSQQSISTLINPPFAMSLAIMFAAIYLMHKGIRYKNRKSLVLASFLFGVLVQVKVYAGLLSLGGLLLSGLWLLITERRTQVIKVFSGSLILSIMIFSPLNKAAQEAIIFKPFWFLETMMRVSDRVYWPRFAEAMVNYKIGRVYLKGIIAYFVAFAIFVIGNMGVRIVGLVKFFDWSRSLKKIDYMKVFFVSVIVAGFVVPMFYVQEGTPWNTIQFTYYSLMLSGILAGFVVSDWIKSYKNKKIKILIALTFVILSLPTTFGTLKHYLPKRPPAKVGNEELEALKFLEKQPLGVVLTYPFDEVKAKQALDNPPRPLYLYESTAYVSAYSDKPVFLEDEVNLNITGYDWRERKNKIITFLNEEDEDKARKFLKENDIEYVYWIKGQRALLGETQLGLKQIFENSKVYIYKVL